MAFRLGVLAAIVAYRRRSGKTRLKTLQQSLKHNKKPIKLYEYPAKTIFSIVFLITLIIGIQWFIFQLKSDLSKINASIPTIGNESINLLESSNFHINYNNETHHSTQKTAFDLKLTKINYVVKFLHLLFCIAIFTLIYALEVKVVTVMKLEKKILCSKYGLIKQTKKEVIQVMSNDHLVIREMGDSKITKTDYYFSVRLISQKKDIHVIKKSCIFDARVVVIKLAHQLQIPFSTKVLKTNRNLDQFDQQQ